MSSLVDAVEKASQERDSGKPRPVNSPVSFLAAAAVFLLMGAGLAALYVYEEQKVTALESRLSEKETAAAELARQNELLSAKQVELEERVFAAKEEQKQRVDELLGRAKVLQYEKETLDSDVAAKEKKIAELEGRISKQEEREAELMNLIELAKNQLADQKTAAERAVKAAKEEAEAEAAAAAAAAAAEVSAAPSPAA